jgi:diadenosine tetraphosphate (Ap4A) HIT family hydrolase
MNEFYLDSRLANDCHILGRLDLSLLCLMNNALIPWFILVPRTDKIEMTDLPEMDQARLLKEINLVSAFLKNNFPVTKLNIAAIGNIVSQLHIHIVGRHPSDFCWPGVVWGTTEKQNYSNDKLMEIRNSLTKQLGRQFTPK